MSTLPSRTRVEENNNFSQFMNDPYERTPGTLPRTPRVKRTKSRENRLNNSSSVYSLNSTTSYPESIHNRSTLGRNHGYDTYIKPKIKKSAYVKRSEAYLPASPTRNLNDTYNGETSLDLMIEEKPEEEASKCQTCCTGLNPRLFISLAYIGAATLFAVMFNIKTIPDPLPFHLEGNLLPISLQNEYKELAVVPLVLWGLHFARRFFEVLFVHKYHRTFNCKEAIGVLVYYWLFALWNGLAMNIDHGYQLPHPFFFYLGLLFFVTGEVGNCSVHIVLRQLRRRPFVMHEMERLPSRHVLPTGFCFQFISCPHYLFEIISWLGFSLICMTMAAYSFFVASCLVLCVKAYRNHRYYRKEFRTRYPKSRKALIPFVF